jgi:hypothetical protein
MIFKPEFAPSDDELAALRRGEEWDPEKAKLLAQKVMGIISFIQNIKT